MLARKDPAEAMRVAAGITVLGHQVSLIFAHGVLLIDEKIEEFAD